MEELKETRQTSEEMQQELESLKKRQAELSTKLQSIQHELERARAEYKRVERITNMETTERDSTYE
ncbi:MAG TPA: hypothetical protein VKA68_18465 [bacterium]|nr:hypothetical protein [bacterium]